MTPGDIFSVLLILGGAVVQLALVSLCDDILTPLTFSSGSVAYAISAVLSAVGENRSVKPSPEVSLLDINLKSGIRPTACVLLRASPTRKQTGTIGLPHSALLSTTGPTSPNSVPAFPGVTEYGGAVWR